MTVDLFTFHNSFPHKKVNNKEISAGFGENFKIKFDTAKIRAYNFIQWIEVTLH